MELSTFQRQSDEIWNAAYNTMLTTPDSEARQNVFLKATQDASAFTSKSDKVNKAYRMYLNDIIPRWQANFNAVDRDLRIKSAKDQLDINGQAALEKGDLQKYYKDLNLGLSTGLITQVEYDARVKNAPNNSVLARARILIGSQDPLQIQLAINNLNNLKNLSGEQLDYRDRLLGLATRNNSIAFEQLQEEFWVDIEKAESAEELEALRVKINASALPVLQEGGKKWWSNLIESEIEAAEKPITNMMVWDELDGLITEYRLNPINPQPLLKRLKEERFVNRTLSDIDYSTLKRKIATEILKEDAYWLSEARSHIEEFIRERDRLSGMLRTERGLMAKSKEALITLDAALEAAREEGKPIKGRDILIKAHEIAAMPQFQAETKKEEEEAPPTIGGGIGDIILLVKEPQSLSDFYEAVGSIKDEDEASAYYEKWLPKFEKKK